VLRLNNSGKGAVFLFISFAMIQIYAFLPYTQEKSTEKSKKNKNN